MALGWQALDAKKARKPLEQGGALEQVGARIKRVMGLTPELSRAAKQRRLGRIVMPQLIQIARMANSPAVLLMFACPIAMPTLVRVKFFIGESAQTSNT